MGSNDQIGMGILTGPVAISQGTVEGGSPVFQMQEGDIPKLIMPVVQRAQVPAVHKEAVLRLVNNFNDKPEITDTTLNKDWIDRNMVEIMAQDNLNISRKLRLKYDFFEREFPIVLTLGPKWITSLANDTVEFDLYKATQEELEFMVFHSVDKFIEERKRLDSVWTDRHHYNLSFGKVQTYWYQIAYMALLVISDKDFLDLMGGMFNAIQKIAKKEYELRESQTRWTDYLNLQIEEISKMVEAEKAEEQIFWEGELEKVRSQWARITEDTKNSILQGTV